MSVIDAPQPSADVVADAQAGRFSDQRTRDIIAAINNELPADVNAANTSRALELLRELRETGRAVSPDAAALSYAISDSWHADHHAVVAEFDALRQEYDERDMSVSTMMSKLLGGLCCSMMFVDQTEDAVALADKYVKKHQAAGTLADDSGQLLVTTMKGLLPCVANGDVRAAELDVAVEQARQQRAVADKTVVSNAPVDAAQQVVDRSADVVVGASPWSAPDATQRVDATVLPPDAVSVADAVVDGSVGSDGSDVSFVDTALPQATLRDPTLAEIIAQITRQEQRVAVPVESPTVDRQKVIGVETVGGDTVLGRVWAPPVFGSDVGTAETVNDNVQSIDVSVVDGVDTVSSRPEVGSALESVFAPPTTEAVAAAIAGIRSAFARFEGDPGIDSQSVEALDAAIREARRTAANPSDVDGARDVTVDGAFDANDALVGTVDGIGTDAAGLADAGPDGLSDAPATEGNRETEAGVGAADGSVMDAGIGDNGESSDPAATSDGVSLADTAVDIDVDVDDAQTSGLTLASTVPENAPGDEIAEGGASLLDADQVVEPSELDAGETAGDSSDTAEPADTPVPVDSPESNESSGGTTEPQSPDVDDVIYPSGDGETSIDFADPADTPDVSPAGVDVDQTDDGSDGAPDLGLELAAEADDVGDLTESTLDLALGLAVDDSVDELNSQPIEQSDEAASIEPIDVDAIDDNVIGESVSVEGAENESAIAAVDAPENPDLGADGDVVPAIETVVESDGVASDLEVGTDAEDLTLDVSADQLDRGSNDEPVLAPELSTVPDVDDTELVHEALADDVVSIELVANDADGDSITEDSTDVEALAVVAIDDSVDSGVDLPVDSDDEPLTELVGDLLGEDLDDEPRDVDEDVSVIAQGEVDDATFSEDETSEDATNEDETNENATNEDATNEDETNDDAREDDVPADDRADDDELLGWSPPRPPRSPQGPQNPGGLTRELVFDDRDDNEMVELAEVLVGATLAGVSRMADSAATFVQFSGQTVATRDVVSGTTRGVDESVMNAGTDEAMRLLRNNRSRIRNLASGSVPLMPNLKSSPNSTPSGLIKQISRSAVADVKPEPAPVDLTSQRSGLRAELKAVVFGTPFAPSVFRIGPKGAEIDEPSAMSLGDIEAQIVAQQVSARGQTTFSTRLQ